MIPTEAMAGSVLADLAAQLEHVDQTARKVRRAAIQAEQAITLAERDDARTAGLALADGKPRPKGTADNALVKAREARREADALTAQYRVLASRLATALTGPEGEEWRTQLNHDIAEAADRVHERLAGASEDVARVVAARRTLAWLDQVPTAWSSRETFPSAAVPDASVPLGTSRYDVLRLLEAVAAWAEPQPAPHEAVA